MSATRGRLAVIGAALVGLLAGCTGGSQPPASPTTSAPALRTASATTPQGPLQVAIPPVEVIGDHAVVTLELSVPADATGIVSVGRQLGTPTGPGVGAVRVLDLQRGQVLVPGVDSAGVATLTTGELQVPPGGSVTATLEVGKPSGTSVDVLLPQLGLVTDVPVVTSTSTATPLPVTGTVTWSPPISLQSYRTSYDGSSALLTTGSQQTVRLGADLLFAPGADTLSTAGAALLDRLGAAMAGASLVGGVQVLVATDGQGTANQDQDLSDRQAAAVVARLRPALGAGVALTPTGKGDTSPLVPVVSDATRAVDRRVEISFTATKAVALPSPGTRAGDQLPTATGNETVGYAFAAIGQSFSAQVTSLVARDGYLVGTVAVARQTGAGTLPVGLLGAAAAARQPYLPVDLAFGAWSLALDGDSGLVYPVQHDVDTRSVDQADGLPWLTTLTDRYGGYGSVAVGGELTVTVIWPDPGVTVATVDVEAPGLFRITGVTVAR